MGKFEKMKYRNVSGMLNEIFSCKATYWARVLSPCAASSCIFLEQWLRSYNCTGRERISTPPFKLNVFEDTDVECLSWVALLQFSTTKKGAWAENCSMAKCIVLQLAKYRWCSERWRGSLWTGALVPSASSTCFHAPNNLSRLPCYQQVAVLPGWNPSWQKLR